MLLSLHHNNSNRLVDETKKERKESSSLLVTSFFFLFFASFFHGSGNNMRVRIQHTEYNNVQNVHHEKRWEWELEKTWRRRNKKESLNKFIFLQKHHFECRFTFHKIPFLHLSLSLCLFPFFSFTFSTLIIPTMLPYLSFISIQVFHYFCKWFMLECWSRKLFSSCSLCVLMRLPFVFFVTTRVNCFLSSIFFSFSSLLFFPLQSLISFLLASLSFIYIFSYDNNNCSFSFLYFFHLCRFSTRQLHFAASGSDKTVTRRRRRRIFYTNMSTRRKTFWSKCVLLVVLHERLCILIVDCVQFIFSLLVLTIPTFEL